MKPIKEYLCDARTPSDEEIRECLFIAREENCVVCLRWYYPYNGWHDIYITSEITFEECKNNLPKVYGV